MKRNVAASWIERLKGRAGPPAKPGAAAPARSMNYASSPLLASKTPLWRSHLLVALVGLSFVGLIAKAVYVQAVNPGFFQAKSEKQHAVTEQIPASRGRIVDRAGRLLAISVSSPTIYLAPQQFRKKPPKPEKLERLLQLLGLRESEFQNRLASKKAGYVPLKREASTELVKQVMALRVEGIGVDPRYTRSYPEGEAMAHLVGTVDSGDRGSDGLEWAFNDSLAGVIGSRVVVRDRIGQIVDELDEAIDPRPGADLMLTIDAQLQALAYQRLREAVTEHKAKSGSVVVLDAQTGEALAITNYPSYSPTSRRRFNDLAGRNRALTDANEPGSTMKPFVVAQAIENGLVRPDTVMDTTAFKVNDRLISDHEHSHPSLTVAQVVQKSSNPGTVRLAMRLPDSTLHEMFTNLGFGRKPNLGLPDSQAGRKMLGAATGRLRPWQKWREVEKATMSYGYGVSVSLVQMARAYTALAGEGVALPISLVKGQPGGGPVRVFKPETARIMREMLRGTVSAQGTASRAQPVGYSAAGKTGTAQKLEGRGYSNSRHCAWFVGFSPADKPRVVVAVMIDEPQAGEYYGGLVAAPVFKAVVEHALRMLAVPPDMDIKATSLAAATPFRPEAEEQH